MPRWTFSPLPQIWFIRRKRARIGYATGQSSTGSSSLCRGFWQGFVPRVAIWACSTCRGAAGRRLLRGLEKRNPYRAASIPAGARFRRMNPKYFGFQVFSDIFRTLAAILAVLPTRRRSPRETQCCICRTALGSVQVFVSPDRGTAILAVLPPRAGSPCHEIPHSPRL